MHSRILTWKAVSIDNVKVLARKPKTFVRERAGIRRAKEPHHFLLRSFGESVQNEALIGKNAFDTPSARRPASDSRYRENATPSAVEVGKSDHPLYFETIRSKTAATPTPRAVTTDDGGMIS